MDEDLNASEPDALFPRFSRRGELLLRLDRMLDEMDAQGISGPAALQDLVAREIRPSWRARYPRGSA